MQNTESNRRNELGKQVHPFCAARGWAACLIAMVLGGAGVTIPAAAQVPAMQDNFSYTTSNLNGHAPSTTGTGTWIVTGSPSNSSISANGSQATISVNGGVLGLGQAFGSYAFSPQPNTIYTLQVTAVFNAPVSTGYGYFGMGFSSVTGGGLSSSNVGPWMETAPQTTTTAAGWSAERIGENTITPINSTVPAAAYGAPMQLTIMWNTATGQLQYYVNGTEAAVGTTALPTGTFYAFFGQADLGNDVNCTNVTLTAQSAAGVQMQDNFSYTTSDITGHVPTTTPAGIGTWTTSLTSGAIISTDGESANINTNTTGVPGTGSATANYAFTPLSNAIYSVTAMIDFNGPATGGGWAGVGFSTSGTNKAPWMYITQQPTAGGAGYVSGEMNGQGVIGTTTLPAADYAAPIAATVIWNTATGQASFYINNYLVSSNWTAPTYVPTGPCHVFFEGFKTGNLVGFDSVALASQNLTTTSTWMDVSEVFTDLSAFANTPTPNLTWPTAQAHGVNVLELEGNLVDGAGFPNKAITQQIFAYCKSHGIKVAVEVYGILSSPNCPNPHEGIATDDESTWISNITSIGGTVDILAFDGPFHIGVLVPTSQGGCQLSIPDAAAETASMVTKWRAAFPNVQVQDIENTETIGSHRSDLLQYQSDLAIDIGKPLDGVLVDMDWSNDAYAALAPYMAQLAQQSPTTAFGLLMNTGGITVSGLLPQNDQQNMLAFEENMQMYYSSGLPVPLNTFNFAGWASYNGTYFPHMVEPETATDSYTNQMDFFFNSPYAHQPPPMIFDRITNAANLTTYYITDPVQLANDLATWHVGTDDGPQGGIEPSASCAPNLVPLYEYYNSSTKQYAYSLTNQASMTNGYANNGLKGYVFPDASEGGHALYQYYDSGHNFYAYSISSTGIGGWVGAKYAELGYTFGTPTIICYMTPRFAPAPGTVKSD